MSRLRILTFALAILTVSSLHGMNGIAQIGYGTKARGMGGVGIALPQDVFTIANNPAGLYWICTRFDAGIHWTHVVGRANMRPSGDLSIENKLHLCRQLRSGRNIIWPEVGASWRFCPNQSLGIALFGYGGFDTLYRPRARGIGIEHTGMEYKQFFVSPAWSAYLGCGFSAGAAVNVVFAWTSIKGLSEFLRLSQPDESNSECPAYATNRGTDHEEGFSLRGGLLWRYGSCFGIGITYQTKTWLNRFKNYKGFLADRGDLDLPSQAGVGLSWSPFCWVTLAGDFSWLFWKDSRQFAHGDQPGVLFGARDGPGFGWHNRPVLKFGIACTVTPCLVLRAGWNWSQIPFNANQIMLNLLNVGMVEHHVTVGGTYCFGRNELSLVYIHGIQKSLRSDSTQSLIIESLRGHQYSLGAAFGRKF